MMGTLAAVLATKKIRTHTDRFRADVEGDIRKAGEILKITEIRVRYRLKAEPGEEESARWCLENYIEKCPAAQSVTACIHIEHDLTFL